MPALDITINQDIKNLSHSPTLLINEQVNTLMKGGEKVTHFGFGQSPFPAPDLLQLTIAECKNLNQYLPSQGLQELRDAISNFHNQFFESKSKAEDVFIGPGSKELLFQLLMLLDGPLLIPSPSWVSYGPQAQILNKPYKAIPTRSEDHYAVDPEVLQDICDELGSSQKQKILLLNSPNNPTGQIINEQQLKDLAKVCKKNSIIVISDEIYALLSFSTFNSMQQFYPEGTIVTSGLSKAFSGGGYRLGYAIVPNEFQELKQAWVGLISETYSCVATPIQFAAQAIYSSIPQLLPYIRKCSLYYQAACEYAHKRLTEMGAKCLKAQGAFYLFPDFSPFRESLKQKNILTSFDLANYLLRNHQVALLPGSAFYMPDDNLSLRMAPVDFDGKSLISQKFESHQLQENAAIEKCFPEVKAGLDKITEFVKSL